MDRTSWIVVTLCTIGIIFLSIKSSKRAADLRAYEAQQAEQAAREKALENPEAPADGAEAPANVAGENANAPAAKPIAPAPEFNLPMEELRLENDEALFQFSDIEGGLKTVELRNHKAYPYGYDKEGVPIIVNEYGEAPIGTISRQTNLPITPTTYAVTRPDDRSIAFSAENDSKILITKTFTLTDDPYMLDVRVDFQNNSDVGHESNSYYFHTGAAAYMHPKSSPFYLLFNWGENGDAHRELVTWYDGGGFLMFKKPPRDLLERSVSGLEWVGPSNQFYASLVIPESSGNLKFWGRRAPVDLKHDPKEIGKTKKFYSLYGGVGFPEIRLGPNQVASHTFKVYTGPRELRRLEKLGHNLKGVMHYDDMPVFGGMFGLIPTIATTLLKLMVWLESIFKNWGIAILIITCLIRLLIWPLHAKSTRTMKTMAKLNPKITEMREKYADDPQKMQQETMKLYRDYGVNPIGGCLPVLLQLPIFLGFYKMLQSAVELRNQDFLWVKDLSMPDSIYEFANFSLFGVSSINLMPLLMAGTMVLQMKLGPKAGDKMQQRIFLFMPVIFLFICYNFASALALYWTGQNIFSIGQTWLMNRKGEPELKKVAPRPTLAEMQKRNAAGGQKPKKGKKRPRTGG